MLRALRERRSEFDDIEVKAAVGGTPERLYETLSSFANRPGGGTIIFGVDDRALTPVGVGNPDQLQRDVAANASEMVPPLRLSMQSFTVDDTVMIVVQVPEVDPKDKPCYYKAAGPYAGSYVRVGDGDRKMTEYEIHTYLSSRGPVTDDRKPVPGASLDDLDRDLVTGYLARLRSARPGASYLHQADDPELMRTLGIVTAEADRDVPTLAGLIVFGRYPQKYYPNLVIALTLQAGGAVGGSERYADSLKAEGPALSMLEQAMSWLSRNLRKRTIVSGLLHQEVPEYPLPALREAIVNAVVHRDYGSYATGTQIQVRLYSNRIEIANPGGLYGPVTVERLGEAGLQATRNSVLARMMEDLGPMENRGTGIRTMLDAMRQANLEPPRFDDDRTMFRVTFLNKELLTEEALAWLRQFAPSVELDDRQRYALVFLRQKGRLTSQDYQRLNSVDPRQAARELRGLVDAGIAETRGTRRGAYYQLRVDYAKNAQWTIIADTESHLSATNQAVLDLIRERGPISAAEIALALSIARPTANVALRTLVSSGLVRPTQPGLRARNQTYVCSK
jgi:ATP-dependent DNA helicase RecG